MNYFAHALPFLDRPYFVAGTAVPDWLAVVDRQVRVRGKQAEAFRHDARPWVAEVAGGVLRHLGDDARFHRTRAFAETSLALSVCVRDHFGGDATLRPAFLGHVLVEVLLDATLIAECPDRLDAYYQALDQVDAERVAAAVNLMAGHRAEHHPRPTVHGSRPTADNFMASHPTGRLGTAPIFAATTPGVVPGHKNGTVPLCAPFDTKFGTGPRLALLIGHFRRERILWNYLEDDKLLSRLNQIMRRVKLPPLPGDFAALLPAARKLVAARKSELLTGA